MAITKNASFKSYGMIFGPPLLSWLLDELMTHKRDSNGFVSTRLVRRVRDSFYNLTDLLLFILKIA